jgi:hypothetical protein
MGKHLDIKFTSREVKEKPWSGFGQITERIHVEFSQQSQHWKSWNIKLWIAISGIELIYLDFIICLMNYSAILIENEA